MALASCIELGVPLARKWRTSLYDSRCHIHHRCQASGERDRLISAFRLQALPRPKPVFERNTIEAAEPPGFARDCYEPYPSGMTGHRKRVKHYHEPGQLHEFTFSCYHRWPLLANDAWRRIPSQHITDSLIRHRFQLVAFVYMPEHVHLLTLPLDPQPEIDGFLAHLKQPHSAEIHDLLKQSNSKLLNRLMIRERPGRIVFRYWQEGPGFDRNLFTPQAVQASIDYIHNNPVVRKLCRRAIDWKWSSARHYLSPGRPRDPDVPPNTALPADLWTGTREANRT